MRLSRCSMSPKARRFFILGQVCLAVGAAPLALGLGGHHPADWLGAARAFFMGLSIAFNLTAVILNRRSLNRGN
jgi:hypothetical protein